MKIYNAIWISDLHLGTRYCKTKELIDFLKSHSSQYLYLVGDIIDTWNEGKNWYWDSYHDELITLIRERAKTSKVVVLSGNHDENDPTQLLSRFPDLPLLEACEHPTIKGKKLLVVHGHQFDNALFRASSDYHFSMVMTFINWYHSDSNILKRLLGNLAMKLSNPRQKKFHHNIKRAVDPKVYGGVVCGHVHKPEIQDLGGIVYYNCGDWVDHKTALAESLTGELRLISYETD